MVNRKIIKEGALKGMFTYDICTKGGGAEKQFIVVWIALGASIKYVRTEGEGGRGPKSVRSKGGCVNLVLRPWPKCVQGGGRGSKKPENLRTYLMDGPL